MMNNKIYWVSAKAVDGTVISKKCISRELAFQYHCALSECDDLARLDLLDAFTGEVLDPKEEFWKIAEPKEEEEEEEEEEEDIWKFAMEG